MVSLVNLDFLKKKEKWVSNRERTISWIRVQENLDYNKYKIEA